jgi:hypothetical protein
MYVSSIRQILPTGRLRRQQLERPSMHGRMIDADSTLGDHLFNMTQAQRIGNVPAYAHQDRVERVMQTLEHSAHRRI